MTGEAPEDEIRRWADNLKRGIRSHELANPAGVTERAWRNLPGYGRSNRSWPTPTSE